MPPPPVELCYACRPVCGQDIVVSRWMGAAGRDGKSELQRQREWLWANRCPPRRQPARAGVWSAVCARHWSNHCAQAGRAAVFKRLSEALTQPHIEAVGQQAEDEGRGQLMGKVAAGHTNSSARQSISQPMTMCLHARSHVEDRNRGQRVDTWVGLVVLEDDWRHQGRDGRDITTGKALVMNPLKPTVGIHGRRRAAALKGPLQRLRGNAGHRGGVDALPKCLSETTATALPDSPSESHANQFSRKLRRFGKRPNTRCVLMNRMVQAVQPCIVNDAKRRADQVGVDQAAAKRVAR